MPGRSGGRQVLGLLFLCIFAVDGAWSLSTTVGARASATAALSASAGARDILGGRLLPPSAETAGLESHGALFDESALERSEEARLAFDDYVDNLLSETVTVDEHARWDWLNARLKEAREIASHVQSEAQERLGHVRDTVDDVVAATKGTAKNAIGKVSGLYDTLTNLDDINEQLREMMGFFQQGLVGDDDNIGALHFILSVLFGVLNGCFLGMMDSLRTSWAEWINGQGGVAGILKRIRESLWAAAKSVVELFRGLFSKGTRGGMSRISWIETKLKGALSSAGDFFVAVFQLLTAPATREFIQPVLSMIVLGVICTLVLLTLPGAGWIVKLAAMVMTLILSTQYLVRYTLPRFKAAVVSCGAIVIGCNRKDGSAQAESFGEILGFFVAVLLIVKPSDISKVRNFRMLFNRNWLAKKLGATFTPSLRNTLVGMAEIFNVARASSRTKYELVRAIIFRSEPLTTHLSNVNLASRTSFRTHRLLVETEKKVEREQAIKSYKREAKDAQDDRKVNALLAEYAATESRGVQLEIEEQLRAMGAWNQDVRRRLVRGSRAKSDAESIIVDAQQPVNAEE